MNETRNLLASKMAYWKICLVIVLYLAYAAPSSCRITDASVVRDDRAIILIATPFG